MAGIQGDLAPSTVLSIRDRNSFTRRGSRVLDFPRAFSPRSQVQQPKGFGVNLNSASVAEPL